MFTFLGCWVYFNGIFYIITQQLAFFTQLSTVDMPLGQSHTANAFTLVVQW